MKQIFTGLILGLILTVSAFAQTEMSKGEMSKDEMSKDKMMMMKKIITPEDAAKSALN